MINYCDDCGEYLGDYVNGVLFKFGQRVTEPHLCPGQPYKETQADRNDEIDRLAHYEKLREVERLIK